MDDVRTLSPTPQAIGLILSILICFAAAALGGLVTTPQIPNWYSDLPVPTWTPADLERQAPPVRIGHGPSHRPFRPEAR